jgi:sulfotransferase family protein
MASDCSLVRWRNRPYTEMQNSINKPVFVVGSPRSGTSILTWCLGQHPNIFALEESTGIGELAVTLGVCYQMNIVFDNHWWSAMDVQREEFFAAFGQTINELILCHKVDLERKRWLQAAPPNSPPDWFLLAQSKDPKARWVDGTPEYSFHICGLRKLFPNALFIHIVRDVTSVVRSMLNFHRITGVNLVANEQEAYEYWLRAVSSCLLAEQAYGPSVVFRLQYSQLVDQREASLRSLLNFLGEPFAPECLTPLRKRINSSNVPPDFKLGRPETDPAVVKRATQLYAEIETAPQPSEPSIEAAENIEAAFNQRVQYVATLDSKYAKAQQEIVKLQIEREQMREGYEGEQQRLNAEREQMREDYEAEQRRLNAELEQMREGYEAEQQRVNAEREQMRGGLRG